MRVSPSLIDFKVALRMLGKHPVLTLVGVLGMAVAIGIGAAVFSVLRTVFDPALPVDGGIRVVAVQNVDAATRTPVPATHLHDLQRWRAEVPAVEEWGAYRTLERSVAAPGAPAEPLRVAEMTASGFRVARAAPLRGRPLVADDERPGAPPVVVIGEEVWRNRFAARGDVVGQTLRLGATPHTVVGVMPRNFAFPINNRVWTPLRLVPAEFAPGAAPPVEVFGRLAEGATLAQAQAQLATVGRREAAARPTVRPRVMPYTRAPFGEAGLPFEYYLFQLVVAMLLGVVAVNVAILVYARTATRTGEIAVRMALGAPRGRVVAQLFAEALALCGVGAAAGLALAWVGVRHAGGFVTRMAGESIPFWWSFQLRPEAVAYAAGLAVLAAAVVGVVPALKVTGRRIQPTLRALGGGTGIRMGRTWTALIVAQVGLAVAVLPLAVALGWSHFLRGGPAGPGAAAERILAARVGLDGDGRAFAARLGDRQAELARRLAAEPGVASVSWASHLPGDWSWRRGTEALVETPDAAAGHGAAFMRVQPEVLDAFGARMLAGRRLADTDAGTAAAVANRSFVDRVLGGGGALGRRFRYARAADDAPAGAGAGGWYEIVGVVEDFPARRTLTGQGAPTLYHALPPGSANPATLVLRVRAGDPAALAGRVRDAAARLDPALRVSEVQPVARIHAQRTRAERALALGIVGVTLSVLLLSAAGIHALMSFTVAQRRREIGIRSALGAQPRRVLGSVFAGAMRQVSLGVAVGSLLGGALMWGEGGLTAARGASLLLAVASIMLGVGALAALGPARRGLRVEPTEALRSEV
jgi:predicted permease